MELHLLIRANGSNIQSVTINGKKVNWKNSENAMLAPVIEIPAGYEKNYTIKIQWRGMLSSVNDLKSYYIPQQKLNVVFPGAIIHQIKDPQHILQLVTIDKNNLKGVVNDNAGSHTVFAQVKQNGFLWWVPLQIVIKEAVEIAAPFIQPVNNLQFEVKNNSDADIKGTLVVNMGSNGFSKIIELKPGESFSNYNLSKENIIPGGNVVTFSWGNKSISKTVTNWNVQYANAVVQTIDISKYFNDMVTNIFSNQYLSPRPVGPTLQLPTQGIGDWTHPLKTAEINDKGFRKLAGDKNEITISQKISFTTPADTLLKNIFFASQWDNYPTEISIPITGKASHAYFLMAGSTNPMQSRLVNGAVIVTYKDNTADTLLLKNPQTWWPIEQDYMDDGYAFTIDAAKPVRIHLKTGKIVSDLDNNLARYSGKMIDGGAATVLDLPLHANKILKTLKIQAIANDVVIGLMSVTLIR